MVTLSKNMSIEYAIHLIPFSQLKTFTFLDFSAQKYYIIFTIYLFSIITNHLL